MVARYMARPKLYSQPHPTLTAPHPRSPTYPRPPTYPQFEAMVKYIRLEKGSDFLQIAGDGGKKKKGWGKSKEGGGEGGCCSCSSFFCCCSSSYSKVKTEPAAVEI